MQNKCTASSDLSFPRSSVGMQTSRTSLFRVLCVLLRAVCIPTRERGNEDWLVIPSVIAICSAIWMAPLSAVAETEVSGRIATGTVWSLDGSPYLVTGDVIIPDGSSLTVEPGVVVKLLPEKDILIEGLFVAIGAEDKPITFTRGAEKVWGNLHFTDFSIDGEVDDDMNYVGGSILKHCIVEYGKGIFCRFGSPVITNCTIRKNESSGIRVEFGGPLIVDNLIYENSTETDPASGNGAGIIAFTDKPMTIARNVVRDNRSVDGRYGGGGICAFADGDNSIDVAENSVLNNYSSTHAGGIFAYQATVRDNLIIGNESLLTGGGLKAIESKILANLVDSNRGNGGGGIYAENSEIGFNSIVRNRSGSSYGGAVFFFGSGNVHHNTVLFNRSTGPSKTGGVYVSGEPAFNYNTVRANSGFAFYTGNPTRSPILNAKSNFWGSGGEEAILAAIYDWYDDSERGLVDYSGHLDAPDVQAPTAPPPPENVPFAEDAQDVPLGAAPPTAERTPSTLSGPVDPEVTWTRDRSPYHMTGNTLVQEGATLVVEPGVTVRLDAGVSFMVRGTLRAIGEEERPITFTKNGEEPWGQFIFADASTDAAFDTEGGFLGGTIVKHCIVEHGSGVLVEDSSPFLTNSAFRNHQGSGISIRKGGPTLSHNQIVDNVSEREGGGIYVYTNDLAYISGNTISGNRAGADGGGIFAYGYRSSTAINILGNAITGNHSAGHGGGIYASRSTLKDNTVGTNRAAANGGGIYTTLCITDGNTVHENTAVEGGGIFAERNSTLRKNTVTKNTATSAYGGGVYINYWGASMENEVFSANEVTGNRAETGNAEGSNGGVFVKGILAFEANNIHDNSGIDLYNGNPEGTPPLETPGCYWGTADVARIEEHIFHHADDESLAEVDYKSFAPQKPEGP